MTCKLKVINVDLNYYVGNPKQAYYEELFETVDVVVTSPPYKQKDGFSQELMNSLALLLNHSLKDGGRAFVNFGQLKESFSRPSIVQLLISKKLTAGQTIAWIKSIAIDDHQKGHFQPINSNKILNYCWEPIYTFSKGTEKPLDRLSLGVPYADKSNLRRGTRGKNGDLHCGGDAWFIPYSTTGSKKKKKHSHEFPEEIVRRCLLLSGVKSGGTVLDPFCGSGTTAAVAKSMGLNCVTLDIDNANLVLAQKRWANI